MRRQTFTAKRNQRQEIALDLEHFSLRTAAKRRRIEEDAVIARLPFHFAPRNLIASSTIQRIGACSS